MKREPTGAELPDEEDVPLGDRRARRGEEEGELGRPVPPRVPLRVVSVLPLDEDDRGERHATCPQCGQNILTGDCLC